MLKFIIPVFSLTMALSAGAQQTTLHINTSSSDARAIIAPTSAVLPGPTEGLIIPRVNRFPATAPAAAANYR